VERGSILLVACLLAICGCGDEGEEAVGTTAAQTSTAAETTTAPSSDQAAGAEAPAPLTACGAGPGWHRLSVRSGPGKLDAAVIGKSESAVVFANESGDASCPWVQFAQELANRDLAVAVFSYASVGNPDEIAAVAEALRDRGAKRVAAIGGSVGARAVVELAAERDPGVDAVISLSAEREVGGQYPDILPQAKRADLPSFYISSRGDGYTLFGKETKQLHAATPAQVNEILLVGGSGHGVDLVKGAEGRRVRPAILAFLRNVGFAVN
jgi:pimeloyl-ACP methyl ester carboxylesterase